MIRFKFKKYDLITMPDTKYTPSDNFCAQMRTSGGIQQFLTELQSTVK